MVIDFHPNGVVEAMHREDVMTLGFLGPMSVTRASDIKFDTETQKWDIWLADDTGGFLPPERPARGFDTYEEARDAEVAWLERCRKIDIAPSTSSGYLALEIIRWKESFNAVGVQDHGVAA